MKRKTSQEYDTTTPNEIDLGDHAEGLFDNWCRDVNAMATPPRKDKAGWDFYVVLPNVGASLIDAQPKLNCSVQVKAQWVTSQQGPPIKLSNWETMISEPLPWFIFVLLYERPKSPIRGALIHVDNVWTTKVMKRLWKNAASANSDLSKLTMRARWTKNDLLLTLDGETILRRIRMHIGEESKYIESKHRWKARAGVRGAEHKITWRFRKDEVDYAQLARAAVTSEVSELPFSAVEIEDVRFGILIPRAPEQVSKLTLKPNPGKAVITFTIVHPVREEFSIEFDTYSTAVLPFLPEEYNQIRLATQLLSLEIARGPKGTTRYRWELHIEEAEVPLGHLVRAARAMRVLLDPDSPPCTLDLRGRTLSFDPKAATEVGVPDDVRAIIDAAINSGVIARSFDLDLNQIAICPRVLVQQEQNLRMLATIFSGSTPAVSLKFHTAAQELHGKRVAYVITPHARIGDRIVLVSIAFIGAATWAVSDEGGELSLVPSIRILERACIPVGSHSLEKLHEQVVRPMLDRGASLLDDEGLEVIRTDPMPQEEL